MVSIIPAARLRDLVMGMTDADESPDTRRGALSHALIDCEETRQLTIGVLPADAVHGRHGPASRSHRASKQRRNKMRRVSRLFLMLGSGRHASGRVQLTC